MNDFKIGDLVLIIGDTEHDDAVAAEFINKHGIICGFLYPQQVILKLLNDHQITVFLKNIKFIQEGLND